MFNNTNQRLTAVEGKQESCGKAVQLLEKRCTALEKRVDYLEELLKNYENLLVNIRNNNAQIATLVQSMETIQFKMKKLNTIKHTVSLVGNDEKNNLTLQEGSQCSDTITKAAEATGDSYSSIDYFDFENHFRGDKSLIKERQKQYLPYFEGCKNVIDIGCGRGEFLELLKEAGISAMGVDTYEEFVEYCKDQGLNAICDNGNHFLYNIERTDGIFVGQVVEHMPTEQIIEMCNIAWEKLDKGSYLIIETPNPTSLGIYTHAFYMDPSHVKPVHPLTMEYFLRKAGFGQVDIVYTDCSKLDQKIPCLTGENIGNLDDFNKAMEVVSDTLFGSQDYAILARK